MAVEVEQNGDCHSHRLGHIDENWPEVMFINDYAVFMGYLSMAVTGTGILVLTWSTVVLLGGFVTMLAKKDFWSLTVITLVQTRIFDVFLNGNISYFGYSLKRLWKAALSIVLPREPLKKWSARGLIRVLVFTTVLCPLFVLYMFGLFVSPVISLWRLVEQDFGDMSGDSSSKANLKPALVVLYSLALFQGVLFWYRAISSLEEQRLLNLVAGEYSLKDNDQARESLSDYLREIRLGCEKDPSFASGRNLITYAVELMRSNSPDSYLSGARVLDTLIRLPESGESRRRRTLINNMVGSTSSGVIKKLVQMLDYSRSRHDSKEIRLCAMRLVAHFASEIRLNKVPYGIQWISSFLDSSEAGQNKGTTIDILLKLSSDKENLSLMSNSNGLALKVSKLLVLTDDQLHDNDHDKWSSSIALPGMEAIKRFIMPTVAATRSSNDNNNVQLRREMLASTDAISTLESIMDCSRCKSEEKLQISVIVVLTQVLSTDTPPDVGNEVRGRLIWSLVGMFLDGGSDNSSAALKESAGESLVQLSLTSEENATFILEAKNGDAVDNLTGVLLDVNSKYRKSSAGILKHLSSHYSSNGNRHFEKLKSAMIEQVIPQVLREVLSCRAATAGPRQPAPARAATAGPRQPAPARAATAGPRQPAPAMYWYPPPPNPYVVDNSYYDDVEVKETLSSLCATVHERLISLEPDLAPRFEQIAAEICRDMNKEPLMSFAALVKEAADISKDMKEADKRRMTAKYYVCSEEDPNSCCIS